jgi:hypothetical protein
MEPEGLLPFSLEPTSGPYPDADESSSHSDALCLKIHFNIIFLFGS